jgi:hypothetical protein
MSIHHSPVSRPPPRDGEEGFLSRRQIDLIKPVDLIKPDGKISAP